MNDTFTYLDIQSDCCDLSFKLRHFENCFFFKGC